MSMEKSAAAVMTMIIITTMTMSMEKRAAVVMITANDQKQLRYRALDLGATDFLTKPVDKVEFLARVKNMLTLSQARKALSERVQWLADEVRKATRAIVQRERETVVRLCKAAEFRAILAGSMGRLGVGYGFALLFGIGFGLAGGLLVFFREVLKSAIIVLQSITSIAWVPLFLRLRQ